MAAALFPHHAALHLRLRHPAHPLHRQHRSAYRSCHNCNRVNMLSVATFGIAFFVTMVAISTVITILEW